MESRSVFVWRRGKTRRGGREGLKRNDGYVLYPDWQFHGCINVKTYQIVNFKYVKFFYTSIKLLKSVRK